MKGDNKSALFTTVSPRATTVPGTQQRPDECFWKERASSPKTTARLMLWGPRGSAQRGRSLLLSFSDI